MTKFSLSLLLSLVAASSSSGYDPGTTQFSESDPPYLYRLTVASDSSKRDAPINQKVQDLCDQPLELYCSLKLGHQEGLTGQKSPMLYFYNLIIPVDQYWYSLRFALIDSRSMRPVAEVPLHFPEHAGLQRIQLGDYGIELEPEIQYQWYVSEIWNLDVPIPEEMAEEAKKIPKVIRIAEGSIVRIDSKHLNYGDRGCETSHVRRLAHDRIWYDAFACVNELIEVNPGDRNLHELRTKLLGKPQPRFIW